MVLGVNPRSSLPEDAKGADSSHGLKKKKDATTEDRSAGNTFKKENSAWKTTNSVDTTSNLVKDLSSKLLEPGRAFWGCIPACLPCSSVIDAWWCLQLEAG